MKEYKIIHGTDADVQMKLNQWRHEYDIQILGFQVSPASVTYVTILLSREKR